jgi:hypothetical protein
LINPELQFYHDTQIVECLFGDGLHKTAQSGKVSALTDAVKHYVENHINPDNKVESLVDILAPGIISMAIGGWFGVLIGLAMRVFNIDVYGIFASIWGRLKPNLSDNKQVSSQQVNEAVNSSVEEHAGAIKSTSMEDTRKWKLVLTAYDADIRNVKRARSGISSFLGGGKSGIAGLLVKVISWVFKVALASAGLMVAGDVVNKMVGRPNAFDDTIQKGKPVEEAQVPICHSTQTKFKINPAYHEENYNVGETNWIEHSPNTNNGIVNMIVNFSKDVYAGLEGLDDQIKSLSLFQGIVNEIAWYNHAAAGDPIIFLPQHFKSKKSVVDCFIDELANAIK